MFSQPYQRGFSKVLESSAIEEEYREHNIREASIRGYWKMLGIQEGEYD